MTVLRVGTVFLAVLTVTEAILRWGVGLGDPPLARLTDDTEYEVVGPAVYHRWGNEVRINSDGLRAEEVGREPAENELRLLLIGDSVVYGGHFLTQAETIAHRLQSSMADDPRFSPCVIRVLPVAVSSWGPANQAAYLRRSGVFGAKWAALIVSAHDLHDVPLDRPDILPYRTRPSVTAIGDAATAVLERVWPRDRLADTRTLDERAAISLSALTQMAGQLRSTGSSVVLVYHPTVHERSTGSRPERQAFYDWAAQADVPFLDLGRIETTPGDYRDDIHPTAQGAGLIAADLQDAAGQELVCD